MSCQQNSWVQREEVSSRQDAKNAKESTILFEQIKDSRFPIASFVILPIPLAFLASWREQKKFSHKDVSNRQPQTGRGFPAIDKFRAGFYRFWETLDPDAGFSPLAINFYMAIQLAH